MPEQASEGSNSGSGDAAFFIAYNVRTNMANKRTTLKGAKTAPPADAQPVQQKEIIKHAHKSTQTIVSKLGEIIVDFLAIEDLSGYDLELVNLYDERTTLRVIGERARLDVSLVSLVQEGGRS